MAKNNSTLRVANAQFSAKAVRSEGEFWQRVETLIIEAKKDKANVVLLPEYFVLPLVVKLYPKDIFKEKIGKFARHNFEKTAEQLQTLADKNKIALIAGTMPTVQGKSIVNRCLICLPNEKQIHQDKLHMTRFEDEDWQVQKGTPELRIFSINGVRCMVNICYDIEFAYLAHMAASAQVQVIFVPSCTDSEHGYWRVRHCAEARAVETQSYVVLSSLVDGIPKFPDMDQHYGQSAIFSPCDNAFSYPPTGILAEMKDQKPGLVSASLDLDKLNKTRKQGNVFNFKHHVEIAYPKNFAGIKVISSQS